jgi:hypothetical protein
MPSLKSPPTLDESLEIATLIRARLGDSRARFSLLERVRELNKTRAQNANYNESDLDDFYARVLDRVLSSYKFSRKDRDEEGTSAMERFINAIAPNVVRDDHRSTKSKQSSLSMDEMDWEAFCAAHDLPAELSREDIIETIKLAFEEGWLSPDQSTAVRKYIKETTASASFIKGMHLPIPKRRPGLSYENATAVIKAFNDKPLKPGEVVILGVRGYYRDSMGKALINDRGMYDDAIFIVGGPDTLVRKGSGIAAFHANVDPSVKRKRMATLQTGVWIYETGYHGITKKNPYPALRQKSSVKVFRDDVGFDQGFFGINIHKGGYATTSSEGCQTVPPGQWDEFIKLVYLLLGHPLGPMQLVDGAKAKNEIRYYLATGDMLDKAIGKGWRR